MQQRSCRRLELAIAYRHNHSSIFSLLLYHRSPGPSKTTIRRRGILLHFWNAVRGDDISMGPLHFKRCRWTGSRDMESGNGNRLEYCIVCNNPCGRKKSVDKVVWLNSATHYAVSTMILIKTAIIAPLFLGLLSCSSEEIDMKSFQDDRSITKSVTLQKQ